MSAELAGADLRKATVTDADFTNTDVDSADMRGLIGKAQNMKKARNLANAIHN